MAIVTPTDGSRWLADVGVEFISTSADRVPPEILASVLLEVERDVRAEVRMTPPESGEEFTGVGAWHVNNAAEAHLLREGRGVVQVVTPEGIVTVLVESGDVMIIRGAEHRFRPLTPVHWVLHYGGPADADLIATPTGRADEAWPHI